MLENDDLQDFMPWTVIAGGSEGVGACFARRLAERGINLVLIARKLAALEELGNSLRLEYGVEVRTHSIDLGMPDAAGHVIAHCADIEVGGLIYNAGAAHGLKPFLEQSLDEYMALMRLNTETQVRLIRHFAVGMCERRRGAIISLGSGASAGGTANLAGYSAAKAYAQVLVEGLWHEFSNFDVKVLCLVLGLTRTPAMARAGFSMESDEFQADDPEVVAQVGLSNIGAGPVYAMDSIRPNIERLSRLPRSEVVNSLSESSTALTVG